MIKESITPDEAIELLNSAIKADKAAIDNLVNARVACNLELADHPTIQVGCYGGKGCNVGLLGILNGLFGIADDGWGCIAAVFEVRCPLYCSVMDYDIYVSVDESCPICNSEVLELGKLIEFIRMR